ncbi:TPA: acetyl-CoA carboxylase biotin carboxylase subunit family protein [Bacillus luti]
MKKVLILGVASVQMDAINILKGLGYETFACAMAKDGPGAESADHFEVINILDIPRLIEYIQENNIDVVYSVGSDIAMPVACKLSEELSLPHFVSSETATMCNNKGRMREALGEKCEGNIPFQVIEDGEIIPEIAMPYIMKPADSQGQRGIFLINSLQEYKDNFQIAKRYSRSGKVIVERYIKGPELSVNVYMVDGELKYIVASDRETWSEYTGLIHKHIVPTKNLKDEMLDTLNNVVVDACKRLGILNGPAYFQMKVEDGNPYIIEMTPRLDGCHMWKLLDHHTNVNLLKLTFEHLLNENISELNNLEVVDENSKQFGHELEFFCQEPKTVMDQHKFSIPEGTLDHFFYYQTGDTIRPVNGKFDKVGYLIKQLEEKSLCE